MTELHTAEALRRAVADEPPMRLGLADVTDRGGRLRRRRRAGTVSAVTATAALVGAALAWAPWAAPGGAATTTTHTSVGPVLVLPGSGSNTSSPRRPTSHLAELVEAASPAGWTFDWSVEALETAVDGRVDDGTGPGGVSVGLSTSTQQVHPCRDPEFRKGAGCTETVLASGAVLSRRGPAVEDGVRSLSVVLTYPDGSGVNAGASNAVVPTGPGKPMHLDVTRPAPVYTLAQLVAVTLAVDAATR